jgi:hypothetical protein
MDEALLKKLAGFYRASGTLDATFSGGREE